MYFRIRVYDFLGTYINVDLFMICIKLLGGENSHRLEIISINSEGVSFFVFRFFFFIWELLGSNNCPAT